MRALNNQQLAGRSSTTVGGHKILADPEGNRAGDLSFLQLHVLQGGDVGERSSFRRWLERLATPRRSVLAGESVKPNGIRTRSSLKCGQPRKETRRVCSE